MIHEGGKALLNILDKNKNIIPATVEEWSNMINNFEKTIVKQKYLNEFFISTVFNGVSYNMFETTVFKGDKCIYNERYQTLKEAEQGHQEAIDIYTGSKVNGKNFIDHINEK